MSLERAWQQKLDRIARVNQEFWTCESCGDEFDIDGMCEHDSNMHTWCVDCCEAFHKADYEEQFGPLDKEDLD